MRVLAHDLRNVLGAVSVSTEVLNSRAKDALEKSALEVLQRQVGRLHGLIGTALEVAKAIDGQLLLSLRRVDLRVLLAQLRGHVDHVSGPDAAAPREVWIDADPGYFLPALQTLLDATREVEHDKADGAGSVIEITADATAVHLSVGPHRPARAADANGTAPRDPADGEPFPERGLDVLLARKILELHGGRLSYGPGGGMSGFTLALPCH